MRRDGLNEAIKRLAATVQPAKIVIFGSTARDDGDDRSDIDILVVLRELTDRSAETVRMVDLLRPFPVDVLVCSEQEVEEWGHLPGTALFEALTEGTVLYEAA
jgi:predicted nucleotidyltransferase